MSEQKSVLAYWAIRGLAGPIRLLLKYTGTPFEDKLYDEGSAPNFPGDAWYKVDKPALAGEMDFVNLPYYIEAGTGLKLTQSLAIMRYIGRKHGLCGANDVEAAYIDMVLYQLVDMRRVVSSCVYSGNPTAEVLEAEELPKWLPGFEAAIAKHGWAWSAGNSLSITDFALYEVLDHVRALVKEKGSGVDVLAAYPKLAAFVAKFEALPAIAEYKASPEYMARPFNGAEALFR